LWALLLTLLATFVVAGLAGALAEVFFCAFNREELVAMREAEADALLALAESEE
jgi:hypothetical protein